MTKRAIILSLDAMGGEDIAYLKTLPNFSKYFETATLCTNVSTVYPSVTYACHTSIVTGKLPKNHGIINNSKLDPKRISPDWFWQRKYIKSTTIYDLAIEKGMKVAAFLWPVTAQSNIQYNLPEIFANRPWQKQTLVSLRNGSPLFQIELVRKFGHLLDGIKQPNLDDFLTASLIDTIQTKAPELIFAHFVDLDATRHDSGTFSTEAYEAIHRLDERFGRVIATLKEKNLYDETMIVVLGDHTQIDIDRYTNLNQLLAKGGYLQIQNNKLKNWKAIAKTCGGSAYIYTRNMSNLEKADLKLFLEKLEENPTYGIERIFSRSEAVQMGADPNCTYMIEALKGTAFSDIWQEGINKTHKADHGFHPDKPHYRTFFSASGPGVKPNVEISRMSLMDIAPTLAKILDLPLTDTDGKIISEIIEHKGEKNV